MASGAPLMFHDHVGEPLRFAFLMIDDMSMMSLASATEPLRSANRLLGREAFRWDLCSLDGAPVIRPITALWRGGPRDLSVAGRELVEIAVQAARASGRIS